MMGTISENFSYREFEATSHEEFRYDNVIKSYEVRDNIHELTVTILEPLREAWGGPIRISSGYRCPALNREVGGVPTSAHTIGAAADLQPVNGDIDGFLKFAHQWFLNHPRVAFDQCIIERTVSHGKEVRWLHVGLKSLEGKQRRQIFKLTKK